jgi:hypothetical protein
VLFLLAVLFVTLASKFVLRGPVRPGWTVAEPEGVVGRPVTALFLIGGFCGMPTSLTQALYCPLTTRVGGAGSLR